MLFLCSVAIPILTLLFSLRRAVHVSGSVPTEKRDVTFVALGNEEGERIQLQLDPNDKQSIHDLLKAAQTIESSEKKPNGPAATP